MVFSLWCDVKFRFLNNFRLQKRSFRIDLQDVQVIYTHGIGTATRMILTVTKAYKILARPIMKFQEMFNDFQKYSSHCFVFNKFYELFW